MVQTNNQVKNYAKQRKTLTDSFTVAKNRKLVRRTLAIMNTTAKKGEKYGNIKSFPAFKKGKKGKVIKKGKIKEFTFIAVKEGTSDFMTKQKIRRGIHSGVGPALIDLAKKINIPPADLLKASENFTPIKGYTILRMNTAEGGLSFYKNYLINKADMNKKLTQAGLFNEGADNRQNMFKFQSIKKNNKFRATETRFAITFRNDATYKDFDKLMGNIVDTKDIGPNDKYRFIFTDRNGSKIGSTKLMTREEHNQREANETGGYDHIGQVQDTWGLEGEMLTKTTKAELVIIRDPNGGSGFVKSEKGGKRSIIQIKNDDDLCLGRCLAVAIAMRDNHPKLKSIKIGRKIQTELTHALYESANIDKITANLDTIIAFEKYLDCSITVIDGDSFNNIVYPDTSSEDYEPKEFNIYLYKTLNHFDLIVNNKVAGFFGKKFFCEKCKNCYSHKNRHVCEFKCNICCSSDCDTKCLDFGTVDWTANNCGDCLRKFPTSKCYGNHIKSGACEKWWKCPKCKKKMITKDHPIADHKCGEYMCRICNHKVGADHKCYMMPKRPKPNSEKYIYFDFEATQDEDGGVHKVNLAVSEYHDDPNPIIHHNTDDFCEWLFSKDHSGYTIIAHNGKGYDYQFIMKWIYEKTNYKPFTIYAGSKIMTFSIKEKLNIRFIDSLNFLTMPLSNFPKTFNIKDLKKGYYPHYFNTKANENYIGKMPPVKDFGADSMKSKDRYKFIDWWCEKNDAGYVWDNAKELLEYCKSDVDILKRSLTIFRQIYIDIADIDPLQYTTIASVCMAIFKYHNVLTSYKDIIDKDIKENTDEEITNEYRKTHKLSDECKEEIRNKVFEEEKLPIINYEDQQFIRRSFFGGRTNANALKYKFKNGEVGHYKDITSLYPTVNFYDIYGKGHLITISDDTLNELRNINKFIEKVNNNEYLGFIECDITPPDDLYFPVLPEKQMTYKDGPNGKRIKVSEKLIFDLKRKKGVWTSMEIKKAIQLGYKITKLYCIKYYPKQQTDLFKGYVSRFIKIKQENSDAPDWIRRNEDGSLNDTDLDKYIANYKKFQQVELTKEKIQIFENPGLRAIAKLCLNSLWGKFGMRLNMPKTEITDDKKKFNNIIFNSKYTDQDIFFIDENRVEIKYKVLDEFVPLHPSTNIGIASFTTSHARLRLYKALEFLGTQVLYFDTDSVVYRFDKNNPNHKNLECGDYLGDWTDELKGCVMVGTFISGGPKNYSYETEDGEIHTKIKGFNLNYNNSKLLNHENMINVVDNRFKNKDDNNYKVNQFNIIRKSNKDLVSIYQDKQYSFGYDKRHILNSNEFGDVFTLPFGHKEI